MAEWYFPLKYGNREQNFNNQGIQYFKGAKALAYAVREAIQNILDAPKKSEDYVEAVFEVAKISKEKFPGYDELKQALVSCRKHTKDPKGEEFFSSALKIMEQPEIPFLIIRDYNTTGLTGVSREDKRGTRWHRLICSEGSSLKEEGAGGSFGIGKKASFALSGLRTVFYGTKTIENEEGFKGISELVTHPNGDGELRFGPGFFGKPEKYDSKPILDLSELDDFFYRDGTGTDIFIPGFKETEEWDIQVVEYVLNNFLVAIIKNDLVVKVKDKEINSENLEEIFEKYSFNSNSVHFYNSLTSPDNRYFVEENFLDEYGKIELYLLSRDNEEISMPNRVALTRKTGMRIKNQKYFPKMYNFAGVFNAEGDKINEFLRKLEPPRHDDWDPNLYEDDPKKAEEITRKIRKWIRNRVNELYETKQKEEIEVEWMSEYFPMSLNDMDEENDSSDETENKNKIKEVEVIKSRRNYFSDEDTAGGGPGGGGAGGENSGNGGSEGSGDGTVGDSDGGGLNNGNSNDGSGGSEENLRLIKSRILYQQNGKYEFLLRFNKNTKADIEFNIIGEIGKETFPVDKAFIKQSGESIDVISSNRIGPITCRKDKPQVLTIILNENIRCAVEVNAVEVQK